MGRCYNAKQVDGYQELASQAQPPRPRDGAAKASAIACPAVLLKKKGPRAGAPESRMLQRGRSQLFPEHSQAHGGDRRGAPGMAAAAPPVSPPSAARAIPAAAAALLSPGPQAVHSSQPTVQRRQLKENVMSQPAPPQRQSPPLSKRAAPAPGCRPDSKPAGGGERPAKRLQVDHGVQSLQGEIAALKIRVTALELRSAPAPAEPHVQVPLHADGAVPSADVKDEGVRVAPTSMHPIATVPAAVPAATTAAVPPRHRTAPPQQVAAAAPAAADGAAAPARRARLSAGDALIVTCGQAYPLRFRLQQTPWVVDALLADYAHLAPAQRMTPANARPRSGADYSSTTAAGRRRSPHHVIDGRIEYVRFRAFYAYVVKHRAADDDA